MPIQELALAPAALRLQAHMLREHARTLVEQSKEVREQSQEILREIEAARNCRPSFRGLADTPHRARVSLQVGRDLGGRRGSEAPPRLRASDSSP